MQDRLHLSPPAERPLAAELPSFEQLQQAAEWFAILRADDGDAGQQLRWHQWLERDPRHRAAWTRVEAVNAGLRTALGQTSEQQLADGSTLWLIGGHEVKFQFNIKNLFDKTYYTSSANPYFVLLEDARQFSLTTSLAV